MAMRLNQLFQMAPDSYLERTVLFSDALGSPEASAITANCLLAHVDIEPVNTRSKARVLASIHQYLDTPMPSYLVPLTGSILVPVEQTPQRTVFMPEFSCSRLLVQRDGETWLRLSIEQGLHGLLPPPEKEAGSALCDSVNYWEFVTDDLVGRIRATAILFKEDDKPWRFIMQQIAGAPGAEVVRKTWTRELHY